jgi:hypothetical protein
MRTEPNSPLRQIIGEKLSAVVFVLDYYQLQFDGPVLTVMTAITVISDERMTKSGDDQFRNHICDQIAKVVKGIDIVERKYLSIVLQDNSELRVSIRPRDYPGPEAVYFDGLNNEKVVI